MNFQLTPDFAPFGFVFWVLGLIVVGILHLAIAFRIEADAVEINSGRIPPRIAPWMWALATLIGGIFVAGLYWLIYYSTLQRADVRKEVHNPAPATFSVPSWDLMLLILIGGFSLFCLYFLGLLKHQR